MYIHTGVASYGGSGARAPSTSNNLIFSVNFRAAQRLCAVASPNIFVFCDSSCGSYVAATRTLFSVLFRIILRATKSFIQFCGPSYQILATPPSIQCNTKHVSTRIFFLLHTWKTIWTNFKRTARLQVLLTIIRMHDRSFVYTYTYSAMTLDNDLDFHTCMQAETTSIHRLVLLLSVSV